MTPETVLSQDAAEQATVERLFRASLDVQFAMTMICEEHTITLLRQIVDYLDLSIKQVQGRALDQWERPERGELPEPAQ